MTRHHRWHKQDLRNREPKPRRTIKLSTALKALSILVLLVLLYETSPARTHPECRGTDVPRYYVD